ncbi:MAG: Nif3-like dinuclear metal center hexameric protein, partial [Oscillospiraceae bacterium]|nr:Nif3-like dinuclear metal center hexameric protein [Oscillospiraceae bacterium]
MKIKEIYDYLDRIAPFSTAAEWDNTGLSVGSLENDVKKIYIALDVTSDSLKEAVSFGADLFLTHHPLIFNPVNLIERGSLIYKAVESGITFISAHSNLDIASGGVSDTLGDLCGIKNLHTSNVDGFLKIGEIDPCSAQDFAFKVKSVLGGKVSFTNPEKLIKNVAVCSGSGGDFTALAKEEGADALLTGEAKHHEYLLSKELDISLIVAG